MAKEKGLEPLADRMWKVEATDPEAEARKYVGEKVALVEEALAGARDIIAERLSELQTVRRISGTYSEPAGYRVKGHQGRLK